MSDLFMRSTSIPNSDIVVCTLAECTYVEKKYSQRTPVKCICRKKCILEVYAHTYVRTEVSEGVDLNQYSIYQTVFYPQ